MMPHITKYFQTSLSYPKGDSEEKESNNGRSRSAQRFQNEFASYERKIANNLGYFAVSRTRFLQKFNQLAEQNYIYSLVSTVPVAQLIYLIVYVNTFIKSVFLAFLILDYFGPVVFLDKIAALDYILCVAIASCGTWVWGNRYPLHEIMHAMWTVENSIFKALGYPQAIKKKVDNRHWYTVWIHLAMNFIGCGCLVIQFYADPKYCTFTYSAFTFDSWGLRFLFCSHEFLFMLHSWCSMTGTSSLCTFQGVALANLIGGMSRALRNQCKAKEQSTKTSHPSKPGLTMRSYKPDDAIVHYKQLILITDRFNEKIAWKLLTIHMGGYCQLISDVFVAIQVLKLPGTGFMDVWFYLEDCLVGVYLMYRVYTFMSRITPQSQEFLMALKELVRLSSSSTTRKFYYRVVATLKEVSLKLGPFVVTPMTVLTALDTFGNYYVCVALW